jgi:hypothetical protein
MWIACIDGFFSTVIDKTKPGRMLIRARCEKDIKNLYNRYRDKCPSMRKPTSDDTRDYRYRISISKRDWVKLAGLLAAAVDYPNFKAEIHQRPDQANKGQAYAEVWATMHRLQVEAAELLPKRV